MDTLLEKDLALNGTHALATMEGGEQATSGQASPARFGAALSAEVYARAKRIVIEYKLLRLYQKLYLRPGFVSIVICNTWRIDRALDSAYVELFERDFVTGEWGSGDVLKNWPRIDLLPIPQRNAEDTDESEYMWKRVLEKALYRVLDASGLATLDSLPAPAYPPDPEQEKRKDIPLQKWQIVNIFIEFYLPSTARRKRKVARKTKMKLKPKRFAQAFRALRKNLWSDVVDRPLLSVVASIEGFENDILLTDYLRCARYPADLARIARENRNLLPLLTRIQPSQWHRQDLFSRRLWVKDGRKSTVVDRPAFCRSIEEKEYVGGRYRTKSLRLQSFASPAAHRWLMRAPATVLLAWRERMSMVMIENLAAANLPKDLPARILLYLVSWTGAWMTDEVRPEYQRFYRLFAAHCSESWKANGWVTFRADWRVHRRDLDLTLDWLRHDGFARGFPDKNSTWASLMRQSNEYHEQISRAKRSERRYAWESLLAKTEINGYVICPLTSSDELWQEGRDLHHCVGDYDYDCEDGHCRIFSVTDPAGTRCTLAIERASKTRWVVQQMYGTCNAMVTSETMNVGKKVAKLYSKLARERTANE
jgi:hypothetical protein